MSDSRFQEFVDIFRDRVRESRLGVASEDGIIPVDPWENAFTGEFLGDMEDIGLIPDSEIIYFEEKLGRANAKLNSYAISEDKSQVHLFSTIYGGEAGKELKSAPASVITKAVNAAVHTYRAAKNPLHLDMEDSCPESDMMEQLHSIQGNIGSIKVIVLVNGVVGKETKFPQPDDLPEVVVDGWDLQRLYRAASSELAYESVTIDMEKILGSPLACLPPSFGNGSLLLFHNHPRGTFIRFIPSTRPKTA